MVTNLITKYSQSVDAVITATPAVGQQFNFRQVNNLAYENIVVYGIEAYSRSQLAVSENGNTLVAANGIPSLAVTLFNDKSQKIIDQYPVFNMIRTNNAGLLIPLEPFIINLTKCYIRVNATTNLNINETVVFTVHYDYI